MSYDSAKRTPLSKQPLFGGGYIDNCSNYDLDPTASPYLKNGRFDGADFVIRPGHMLYASFNAGTIPHGIGSYLRNDPTGDRLVVRNNSGLAFTAAYLTGGTTATTNMATRQAVTNGCLAIRIDRTNYKMVDMDFSGTSDMDDVAAVIQAAIRVKTGKTETVVRDTDHFVITSSISTINSQVDYTTPTSYTKPAYATCAAATTDMATRRTRTNGMYFIYIDGVEHVLGGDFSACNSIADVTTVLQLGLTPFGATITRVTDHFVITSGNSSTSSQIDAPTNKGRYIVDIGGRNGYVPTMGMYGCTPTANVPNVDIGGSGTTKFMACALGQGTITTNGAKGLIVIDTNGNASSIDTGVSIQSDNRMNFVNANDSMYCMNGSDQMGKLHGTTYSTINTGFSTITFNSSGLSDLHMYGGNTVHTFLITIDAAATPDTFTRTIDGGGGDAGVAITGGYQTLSNGVSIKFDNTTGHTLNDNRTIATSATATPAFGVIFNSSMFVAGVPGNMDTVFKSVGNIYEDFCNLGSDTFKFGEPITGLCANNQALFYFTKNSIAVTGTSDIQTANGIVSYTNRGLATGEGAYNHECIVPVGNNIYYLNASIQINQVATGQNINGFEVLPMSGRKMRGISKIMDTLDRDQSGSYGEYLLQSGLIKRHLKSTGATYPDVVIVYDTTTDKFLLDSNKYFNGGVDFHQYHYSISAVEAKLFKDEYGTDDDGSAIPFEYRTKEFTITDATLKKILREARTLLDINELASLTQEIRLDGALKDTKVIDKDALPTLSVGGIGIDMVGTDAVGLDGILDTSLNPVLDTDYQELVVLRTKGNLNMKCKKMQFRRYCTELAAKVRLKNVTVKIEQLDPLTNELTA